MAIAVVLGLGGCTGVVGDAGGPTTGGGSAALCQTPDPGPSVIRRMTRLEYRNTLRDLLGSPPAIADAFPAEERRLGFDNNAAALSTSPVLVEQYLLAAEKAATDAVNSPSSLAAIVPCDAAVAGTDACGRQFINAFAPRAYRGPLSGDDVDLLTSVFDAGKATDFKTGVRLVIETVLQSPRFLYRVEFGTAPQGNDAVVRPDHWEMASRLSYLLWHSMPDDALVAAAQAGRLGTAAEIQTEVDRMLQDPKARGMVADFYSQWLGVGDVGGVEKDRAAFPTFTSAIAGFMQQETAQFLDHVTWEDGGDLDAVFSAPFTFLNGPLAQHYGIGGVSGNTFVKVSLEGSGRGGFLTQGGILSLLGKANQTSPVHRGKFVREQFLCDELPPPPADLMVKAPELSTTLTTRQRFTQHASDKACSPCHRLMDPIGLGFEAFDGAGVLRSLENGQPVDTSGEVAASDVAGPFNGVSELGHKLAGSDQVRACVATKWFRYGTGRGETTADACSMGTIKDKFAAGGYKIRDLMVALTQSDAFLYRRVTPAAGGAP
ncbi:MAG: DUF1592 domain-containing protein [Bacteroidota bacterium]